MRNKTIITALIFPMLMIAMFAQGQEQKKPDTKERVKNMVKVLGISQEKSTALVGVMDLYQRKMTSLMQDKEVSPKVKQEQLKVLMSEQERKIAEILSKEEQEKLKALLSQKYDKERKKRQEEIKSRNKTTVDQKKQ